MPEEIKFKPEAISEYQKKLEKLKKQDGFMLERDEENQKNIISFLGIQEEIGGKLKDKIIEFETDIEDEKELREIIKDFYQTPLSKKMLSFVIESYKQQRIPLMQSLPGTGKTFIYKKFNQLLHGKDAKLEYIACTPRTSELEIIGHWAPSGKKELKEEEIEDRLNKNKKWKNFIKTWEKKFENLVSQKDTLKEEEFQEDFEKLMKEYGEFQRQVLNIEKESSEWIFQRGALLAGYKNSKDPTDKGRFIIIDEIDNLPENYQNIFLQLSGERGKLADKIRSYSDSGVTEYQKGKNTFVVFAANYPELATGKRTISAPLADRVDWLSITPNESLKDEKLRIERFGFKNLIKSKETAKEEKINREKRELPKYSKIELPTKELLEKADPKITENIRSILARSLAILHTQWKSVLADYRKEGIELSNEKTRSREQEKEFSQRAAVGLEDFIIANLNNPAYINPETERIDLTKLFYNAFQLKYLNFLASNKLKIRFQNEQLLPLLYGGTKQLIEKDNEEIEIKEIPELKTSPFAYIKEKDGTFRPYDSEKDEGKEIFTMAQALNILIKQALMTEEEKKFLKEKKQEELKRKTEQMKFDSEDLIEDLIKNQKIPDLIKDKLTNQ